MYSPCFFRCFHDGGDFYELNSQKRFITIPIRPPARLSAYYQSQVLLLGLRASGVFHSMAQQIWCCFLRNAFLKRVLKRVFLSPFTVIIRFIFYISFLVNLISFFIPWPKDGDSWETTFLKKKTMFNALFYCHSSSYQFDIFPLKTSHKVLVCSKWRSRHCTINKNGHNHVGGGPDRKIFLATNHVKTGRS